MIWSQSETDIQLESKNVRESEREKDRERKGVRKPKNEKARR